MLVVVSSDLELPTAADVLALEVSNAVTGGVIFTKSYELTTSAALPASLDLHGSAAAPNVTIHAQLLKPSAVVVDRIATLPFLPDRAIELRLDLDRACVNTLCSVTDQTCSGGVCIPTVVDPSTLPAIGKDPIAAIDGGTCGPPVLPATLQSTCTVYTFERGIPAGLVVNAAQGTSHVACSVLAIDVAGGSASRPDDWYTLSLPPATGDFTFTASYHDQPGTGSFVGIESSDASTYFGVQTEPQTGTQTTETDRWEIVRSDGAPLNRNDSSAIGVHTLTLIRTQTTTGSTYRTLVDGALVSSEATGDAIVQSASQTPAFYVSSAAEPIHVQLDYLAFCPN